MSDYTLTQKEYSKLKSRLTRAINTKDPYKIIKEVNHAEAIFEEKGFPDYWMNWMRAREDAQLQLLYHPQK